MSGTTDPLLALKQHFATNLRAKCGFEVADVTTSETTARFLGRLPKDRQGDWLLVIHRLLLDGAKRSWKIDISKSYFLRGGKLVYGWRLILQGGQPVSMLEDAINSVVAAPQTARAEITSAPLVGASIYRTQEIDGKGVGAGGGLPPVLRLKRG
jgi:hypothetical protein